MNKFLMMTLASMLVVASIGASAAEQSNGAVVVPIGPASIKVVEIGASAVKKDCVADSADRTTASSKRCDR